MEIKSRVRGDALGYIASLYLGFIWYNEHFPGNLAISSFTWWLIPNVSSMSLKQHDEIHFKIINHLTAQGFIE